MQIVYSNRRGSQDIEHIGSAHDEARLELLKAAARQRLAAGQGELDLGRVAASAFAAAAGGGPLPITSTRMARLWDALSAAFDVPGFDAATEGDEVFRQLVLARIVEPTSKLDSARVLEEIGVEPVSYPTVKQRLGVYAKPAWRSALAAAGAARCGWDRHRWSSTTSRPCTSRPTPGTGSVSRGSPRNAGWSRRSRSGC